MAGGDEKTLQAIKRAVDVALESGANPIAAFDADGTLWNTDIGEAFFQFQIKNKLVELPANDPWEHYHKLKDVDTPKAYTWLAQINSGQKLETVREWARAATDEFNPLPIFPGIKAIIEHLQTRGIKIFVVTASVQWAVEPGAARLGIPKENVIGILTKVENGIVTDIPDKPVSWREGKVTRLLLETKDTKPFFAAGNTTGDLALLEAATHVKLVNCATKPNDDIYGTEQALLKIAKERGWFNFTYR